MSVQALRTALNALFDRTLTAQQVQRVASAFYEPQEGQSNDEVADIVLRKIRRRVIAVVKQREADAAAAAARQAAEQSVDEFEAAFKYRIL